MRIAIGRCDKISAAGGGIIRDMDVLYLDLWFGLNLLCDYLLCLLTARAAGLSLKRPRYALAALLGAVYACAAYLPSFQPLSRPGWKLLTGVGMAWTAFGDETHPLRCILLFFAVSAAFGGTLLALTGGKPLSFSLRELLLSFLLCYGIGRLLFRCHVLIQDRQTQAIRVEHGGHSARFYALLDTGNRLRDPVSGSKVLIASPRALREILRANTGLFERLGPVQLQTLSEQIPEFAGRMRLLPYTALGGEGLLPVFRPDRLFIDGQERNDYLIAVSPQAAGDDHDAII